MAAGDQTSLHVTSPEDYSSEQLQGVDAVFAITCKSVKALALAPLDAELFASYGVEEGGEPVFREEVQKNMERELRNAVQAHIKNQVMDGVVAAHDDVAAEQRDLALILEGHRVVVVHERVDEREQVLDLAPVLELLR